MSTSMHRLLLFKVGNGYVILHLTHPSHITCLYAHNVMVLIANDALNDVGSWPHTVMSKNYNILKNGT